VAVVAMAEGFLGRWSQRKQAVREGKPADSVDIRPAVPAESRVPAAPRAPVPPVARPAPTSEQGPGAEPASPPAPVAQPEPPSMQDVAALNAESDFKPFMARAVSPEVRNAAMKKLFADPHFNVMDGLDIYIDDYSIPDPLPAAMLRKMASAQFLNLFDDKESQTRAAASDTPAGASAAAAMADADADADPGPDAGTDGPDNPALGMTEGQAQKAAGAGPAPDATPDTDKTDPAV
jgi:hypothetical protein